MWVSFLGQRAQESVMSDVSVQDDVLRNSSTPIESSTQEETTAQQMEARTQTMTNAGDDDSSFSGENSTYSDDSFYSEENNFTPHQVSQNGRPYRPFNPPPAVGIPNFLTTLDPLDLHTSWSKASYLMDQYVRRSSGSIEDVVAMSVCYAQQGKPWNASSLRTKFELVPLVEQKLMTLHVASNNDSRPEFVCRIWDMVVELVGKVRFVLAAEWTVGPHTTTTPVIAAGAYDLVKLLCTFGTVPGYLLLNAEEKQLETYCSFVRNADTPVSFSTFWFPPNQDDPNDDGEESTHSGFIPADKVTAAQQADRYTEVYLACNNGGAPNTLTRKGGKLSMSRTLNVYGFSVYVGDCVAPVVAFDGHLFEVPVRDTNLKARRQLRPPYSYRNGERKYVRQDDGGKIGYQNSR